MKRSEIMLLGLMLLVASVLPAAAQDDVNVSKLTVQGEGKVLAAPDIAIIVLGVETRNASAAGAVAENAILMNSTKKALMDAGIAEKDIQTSTYRLSTREEEPPIISRAETGIAESGNVTPPEFIATNRVTVRINDTRIVGQVLDAAIAAGSNNIQSISFDLSDPAPEKDRALAMAIEDASRKAEVAASAAGVELGRIVEISEGYSFVSARSEVAYSLAAAPTTPISPGELEVTASVTMTYEIS